MFETRYRKRIEADLARWTGEGLISSETAGLLRADVAGRAPAGLRVPMLLGAIGVIFLALSIAAFVAANWDGIPRVAKLIGIFAAIAGAHGLAAVLAGRGRKWAADMATMFATLVFISGIALVGQIYHLPADWEGGALLVSLGALAAAWLTRSRGALVIAAIAALAAIPWWEDPATELMSIFWTSAALFVACLLHVLRFSSFAGRVAVLVQGVAVYGWVAAWWIPAIHDEGPYLLAIAAVAAALAVWGTLLRGGRVLGRSHPMLAGLPLFAGLVQNSGIMLLSISSILTISAVLFDGRSDPLALDAAVIFDLLPVLVMLAAALIGCGLMLAGGADKKARRAVCIVALLNLAGPLLFLVLPYATVLHAAIACAALIAVSALGVYLSVGAWTVAGNLWLAILLLLLLHETIGSLLGQSAFFLVAGLVMVAVAFVSARMMMRRRAATTAEERT
ncbi:DUF2157 domain-containing protein [Stappia indica]|uniref:DUF2157 domain-containing protein n=1 Tax=Stappia indica TaxID=538381 RepID=UPI001CD1E3AA|nr:DUF2157 domain-containing protein [Stappia indica]MCA1298473.1 DUF2157 domain-containing protein [Stappia indica]